MKNDSYQVIFPDYENSILNVSATIVKHYGGKSNYASIPELEVALKKQKKHVILMLLDGMGTNITTEHLKPEDFLRKYQVKTITSVYPPTTVAATNAVLSVKAPYSSGYLGWVQYFKKEDTNCVVFLNQDFYEPEKKYNEVLREKYLSYQSIYEIIEESSKETKTYELFPSFRKNGYQSFKEQLHALSDIVAKDESSFTYVYWTDPDLTEHEYGIHSLETKHVLEHLNQEITLFTESLNDDTILVVIADHGLVDVEGIDLFLDQQLFHMLKRKPSIEPRSTNFFVKMGKKKKFKKRFEELYQNEFILYNKRSLLESKLLGHGMMHPMTKACLGDYIAISKSKYMFNSKDKSRFKAHHAGLTKGEMEVPLIIYST